MGKISWYRRIPAKAIDEFKGLTLEEAGAYAIVTELMYIHDGELEDDERFVCGMLRVDARVWKRIRSRLLELKKVYLEGEYLKSSPVAIEVRTALARSVAARQAGETSVRKRIPELRVINNLAPAVVGGGVENVHIYRDSIKKEKEVLCETQPTLNGLGLEQKPISKNRGTRLSSDWRLPSDWKQDAISKGMRAGDVEIEEQRFRNYWIAKAGAGAVKVDWHATWRNWILNNLNRNGFGQAKTNGHAAAPIIKKDPRVFTDAEWIPKLKFYKNTRNWSPDWGPELGERGCLVPTRLNADGKFTPY